MVKKETLANIEQSSVIKEFIKKNWPLALALAGATGVIGAAVWLTARYLKENSKHEDSIDSALTIVENEVELSTDSAAILLETGSHLGHVVGHDANDAANKLAENTDDGEAKDALLMLGHVTRMEVQNSNKSLFN